MFEQDFENLLSQYADALDTRSRFSGLIKDYFPGQQKQVNLLLAVYDMDIINAIQGTAQISHAFAWRFVKRLMDEYGTSRPRGFGVQICTPKKPLTFYSA